MAAGGKHRSSDVSALYKLTARAYNTSKRMRKDVVLIVRQTHEGVMQNVKRRMPVATGRAKAGWGKYTPEHLVMKNVKSKKSDAVWIVSEQGLSITQGTNVPYTARLNAGHSRQAPAGFIDAAYEFGVEDLRYRLRGLPLLYGERRGGSEQVATE